MPAGMTVPAALPRACFAQRTAPVESYLAMNRSVVPTGVSVVVVGVVGNVIDPMKEPTTTALPSELRPATPTPTVVTAAAGDGPTVFTQRSAPSALYRATNKSAVPLAVTVVAPARLRGTLATSPGPQVVVPLNLPVTAKLPSLNEATAFPVVVVLAAPVACLTNRSPLTVVPWEPVMLAVTVSVAVRVCSPAVKNVTPLAKMCVPLAPVKVKFAGSVAGFGSVDVKATVPA